MKRRLLFISIIGLIGLVFAANLGAATVYDDFTTDYVKKTLWRDQPGSTRYLHEFVREIDADRGVLVLKLGTNESRSIVRNPLGIQNSRRINRVRTDVKVVAMNIDKTSQPDTATVFARIAGYYYNAVSDDPPDDIGDVVAELCIGDRGSGLEAWYRLEEVSGSDAGDVLDRGQATLVSNLETDKIYTLDLEHHGDGTFTFLVFDGDDPIGSANVSGPTPVGPSREPVKGLGLGVHDLHGERGDGYIHAEFDNVVINGEQEAYDTFSNGPISMERWVGGEYVRESVNGMARLHTRADGSTSSSRSRLLLQDSHTPYLEATLQILSTSMLDDGAVGQARIGGYYYNQTHDPDNANGHEGEVWAQISVEMTSDRNLLAVALIKVANADKTEWTTIYREEFDSVIMMNSADELAIEFTGQSFRFRCNSRTLEEVPIETDVYPTSYPKRVVESVVLVPDGQGGFLNTLVDKVVVADPSYNGTGTWISVTSDSVIDEGPCEPGPEETLIATASQTGCEITIMDSLDHVTGGVVSGARLLGRGDFVADDQQTDFEIDAVFSDADHGAGTLKFESTIGCTGHSRITLTRAYALGLTTQGQGTVNMDPASGPYAVGTEVNLTATPANGYDFLRWEGNVADAAQAATTITMNDNQAVTAVFIRKDGFYDLTLNVTGQGGVDSSPGPGPYAAGTSVNLTATAADGWAFVRWDGDVTDPTASETTITLVEDETVTALFVDKSVDNDSDAVPDHQEYGPGGNDPGYDGNGDGVADSTQGSVCSGPAAGGGHYVTLAVDPPMGLADVSMVGNPSPDDAPADMTFDWGFFQFTITGVTPGDPADIKLHLPAGSAPDTYYKHGPTAADTSHHWYEFAYDTNTGMGAEYNGNVITLHLKDGADGDDDMAIDGRIVDIGAPAAGSATPASPPPPVNTGGGGGGGGGCFIDTLL